MVKLETKDDLVNLIKAYDDKITALETKLEQFSTSKQDDKETPPAETEGDNGKPKGEPETDPEPEQDLDEIEKLIQGGV